MDTNTASEQAKTDHKNGQAPANTSSWGSSERATYQGEFDYQKKQQEDANKK
jgi:hypothetical protein